MKTLNAVVMSLLISKVALADVCGKVTRISATALNKVTIQLDASGDSKFVHLTKGKDDIPIQLAQTAFISQRTFCSFSDGPTPYLIDAQSN